MGFLLQRQDEKENRNKEIFIYVFGFVPSESYTTAMFAWYNREEKT